MVRSTATQAANARRRRRAPGVVTSVVLALAATLAIAGAARAAGPTRVRLEIVPLTTPLARLLVLDDAAQVRQISFYPSRHVVVGDEARPLGAHERRRIDALLAAAAHSGALAATYAGDGLTEGDQFRLWLAADSAAPRETWGFIDRAPADLRTLVAALRNLAANGRLAPRRLDAFYLRARPVDPERLDDLVRTTAVRIVAPSSFPPAMQPILRATAADPMLFHPLPSACRKDFNQHRSLGDDVFLRVEGTVFQLQLHAG